jgi:hypothetical protein
MDVNGIQQSFGNGLIELETGVPQLTAIDPQDASSQINQSKAIIMDTQVRLSKISNEMAEVELRLNEVSINQQEQQTQQVVNNLNDTQNMETGAMTKNRKEIKAFNLNKQAQFGQPPVTPFGADNFNDTPELGEDQFNAEQDMVADGLNREQFTQFLKDLAYEQDGTTKVINFVKQNASSEYLEDVDELATQFMGAVGDDLQVDNVDILAGDIYDRLDSNIKEVDPNEVQGVLQTVGSVNDIIKKLAEEHVKKIAKTEKFNLKTAQQKTMDTGVIMYGPESKRFDPFYRQPVSDWHIMERNKGFGLTFDNVWDVDYEAIWRGTVMDKYSRPYRDKDGNWVGGYINKRFEVDHNIPETNNYQLKPGQLRRATPPEYGSTESRLQAARADGDVKGGPDVDRSKPFNWKEASAKKKS